MQELETKSKIYEIATNSLIKLDDVTFDEKGKGHKFVSRFIEPGIAHYSNLGDVLITKETLDKFINSMVGCPVIINHQDITDNNVDKERVGVISNVWYNPNDGWFYCDGVIWDKQAIDLIKNEGWNVSCAYSFKSDKKPVMYHGKQVDMEFTDGDFQHLAIVKVPRYENANIVVNSKGIENGGEGSGDFDHAGRPPEVGGSEPAGTGRKGKYKGGEQQWTGKKPESKEDKKEDKTEKSAPTEKSGEGEDLKIEDKARQNIEKFKKRLSELEGVKGKNTERKDLQRRIKNLEKVLSDNENKRQFEKDYAEGKRYSPDDDPNAEFVRRQKSYKPWKYNSVKNDSDNVKNGFITIDAGTENERVIWIPFDKKYLSNKAKKRVIDIIDNHKQGDEPTFDFSHTRIKPTNEQIKYLKDTINDIAKDYNFKGLAQVEISSELNNGSLGVCVSTNKGSVVSLSPKIYSGKYNQQQWDKSVKDGFHPKGTGEMIKSIFTHEIGHAITCDNVNKEFWREIEAVRKDYFKNIKSDDIKNPDYISKYARTNKYEFVAEAFSQGRLSKKYGQYTQKVMNIMNNYFGKSKQLKLALNDNDKQEEKTEFTFIEEFGRGYPIDEETFAKWQKLDKTDNAENKVQNDKERKTIMAVLNELKDFVLDIVRNEKDDKRAGIDKVAGIMKSAGCDDEDIRTAIGIMEKVAYDKSEAGTADNKKDVKNAKVCNEDKRKLIDEIGGILKSQKVGDEVIRTVIKKAEELSYEPSEDDKADNCRGKAKNACKNEETEEKKEEFKEEKEIGDVKNSMDDLRQAVYGGVSASETPLYLSQADRIELGNNY